jgi:hypothetical protein
VKCRLLADARNTEIEIFVLVAYQLGEAVDRRQNGTVCEMLFTPLAAYLLYVIEIRDAHGQAVAVIELVSTPITIPRANVCQQVPLRRARSKRSASSPMLDSDPAPSRSTLVPSRIVGGESTLCPAAHRLTEHGLISRQGAGACDARLTSCAVVQIECCIRPPLGSIAIPRFDQA